MIAPERVAQRGLSRAGNTKLSVPEVGLAGLVTPLPQANALSAVVSGLGGRRGMGGVVVSGTCPSV